MVNEIGLTGLDSLLLQLALETRELCQKKDELNQQIQMCKFNIQEKKKFIDETQEKIKKINEEILQKEKDVKSYKDNVKSLRRTNDLLLQYEKTLETELERRQDSCNQDMKMFQERLENCSKIFQQYKEEYSKNPVATKLLGIQAEKEETQNSFLIREEQIIAKEGEQYVCGSGKNVVSQEQQTLPTEGSSQIQSDASFHEHLHPQCTEIVQDDVQIEMQEKDMEKSKDQADGCDESDASKVGAIGSTIWTKHEKRSDPLLATDQKQQEETSDTDCCMNTSPGSDVMEEMMKGMEVEDLQDNERDPIEKSTNEGAVPSSPVRMTAVLNTPAFSLNSPSKSPAHQECSEKSAFVLSMISEPATPGFHGFGCEFDVESSQNEESPFTFTSTYFSDKKSPEAKLPGFLFHESEAHSEEQFEFSFGSKSPQLSSFTQKPEGTGEPFPFSFNFGKF
ncbi:protein SIX6OS1 isoform X2 [Hoplias malabaricus]|uniref:protein SIX6OS1 isoform X2 n=1 Tax=Hoplias malabaricus TaxID=27720 RepID=UPI003461DCA2